MCLITNYLSLSEDFGNQPRYPGYVQGHFSRIFRCTRGWWIGVGELGLVLVHQMTQRINRLIASGPSNLKFHPLLSTQFQNFNFKYEPNHYSTYNNIFKIHYMVRFALQRHHVTESFSNRKWPIRFWRWYPLSYQLFMSVILVQSGL